MFQAGSKLMLPRGSSEGPLVLQMETIYAAERRIEEVKDVNPETSAIFMLDMNRAANDAARYLAWIRYEYLIVRQKFDRRKAVLLLEEFPLYCETKKIKPSEETRNAFIMLDDTAFQLRDKMDCLEAATHLLEAKIKTFVRAYNTGKVVGETRRSNASQPIMSPGANNWSGLKIKDFSNSDDLGDYNGDE